MKYTKLLEYFGACNFNSCDFSGITKSITGLKKGICSAQYLWMLEVVSLLRC